MNAKLPPRRPLQVRDESANTKLAVDLFEMCALLYRPHAFHYRIMPALPALDR
jgi:hypothetical protein